ncbi:MAG: FAD-dependent tricarballylate dehydrogenase TcuA, partial [Candidatus Binataceae bacterium]
MPSGYDVIVVGGGNAAFCAAMAARENGASVLVLECAPQEERGGNSRFTAGAMRVAYNGVDDLMRLMPDLTEEEKANTDFGAYTEDQFYDDLCRVTQYHTNPQLADTLVRRSFDTMLWMHAKGIRFTPIYGRQAFKIGGKFKFWGGLTIEAWGGGPGLIDAEYNLAARSGIEVWYRSRALELLHDDGGVRGVALRKEGHTITLDAHAVVLACGGFEANAEWRTRYIGPGWDLAKVRGTRFNTGDGIRMALEAGAMPYGNWSGCHAVGWDRNAPEFGDLSVGDGFQKHSYPFGIMVNARGRRFVDEGADFRNYTYAKYGRAVLEQPGQFAWQVFDQKVTHLLRDEYRIKRVTKVSAPSLEELVGKLEDVDPAGFLDEVHAYNAAVQTQIPFNPNIKDGR